MLLRIQHIVICTPHLAIAIQRHYRFQQRHRAIVVGSAGVGVGVGAVLDISFATATIVTHRFHH